MRMPERHIRASLRLELGLDEDEIERALSDPARPSLAAKEAVVDLTEAPVERADRSAAVRPRRLPVRR
jgi:hypothetical protein